MDEVDPHKSYSHSAAHIYSKNKVDECARQNIFGFRFGAGQTGGILAMATSSARIWTEKYELSE